MLFPKILVVLSQCIIFIRTAYVQDQLNSKIIKFNRFDGKFCGTKVPMEIFYIGMKSGATSVFILNNTVYVKENLVSKPKMIISIRRCNSRENLDSCEEFHQMRNLDYCQTINPDTLIGQSPLAVPFQPKFKCPITKGVYHAYNFTVSLTPFLFFKLEGWYWRIRLDVISPSDKRLLSCLNIEAYTALHSQT